MITNSFFLLFPSKTPIILLAVISFLVLLFRKVKVCLNVSKSLKGERPIRSNSSSMYTAAFSIPTVPVALPSISSEANVYRCFFTVFESILYSLEAATVEIVVFLLWQEISPINKKISIAFIFMYI